MTNLDSKMLDFIDDFALSEADLNERVGIESKAFGIRLKDLMLCEVNPLVANMNAKQRTLWQRQRHLSKGGENAQK